MKIRETYKKCFFTVGLILGCLLTSCAGGPEETPESFVTTKIETSTETATETIDPTEGKEMPEELKDRNITLHFNGNGELKVLFLSDLHISSPGPSKKTQQAIQTMIDKENPDLVLLAGDNTMSTGSAENLRSILALTVSYIEEKQIPWAHIYGNHEEDNSVTTVEQQKIYESFEYCISKTGPKEVKGTSNYVLPIYSSKGDEKIPLFTIYGLDMGGTPTSYNDGTVSPATWYKQTSKLIEEYVGSKVPGLAYFHIPLSEYSQILSDPEGTGMDGIKGENICTDSITAGMMSAMVNRKDIKIACCGHDHKNTFSGTVNGIKLCYCGTVSFDGYHDETTMGARVVVIKESNPGEPETYMSYLGTPIA